MTEEKFETILSLDYETAVEVLEADPALHTSMCEDIQEANRIVTKGNKKIDNSNGHQVSHPDNNYLPIGVFQFYFAPNRYACELHNGY